MTDDAAPVESKSHKRYAKGWNRDLHPDVTGGLVPQSRHLFGAVRGLGTESILDSYVDVVRDQSTTSECVGFASARIVHMRCAIMGTRIAWPSTAFIYALARMQALAHPEDALSDSGSQPYLAVQVMQEWGIPSDADFPFDPATVNDKPTLRKAEEAASFILSGIYRIDLVGASRVAAVQQALDNKFPVMLGVQVDQAFEDYSGDAPVTAPNPAGLLGGHMLPLTGYTTKTGSVSRELLFRGVNSWSEGWGDKGFFWATPAWLEDENAGDIYVCTVSAAAQ